MRTHTRHACKSPCAKGPADREVRKKAISRPEHSIPIAHNSQTNTWAHLTQKTAACTRLKVMLYSKKYLRGGPGVCVTQLSSRQQANPPRSGMSLQGPARARRQITDNLRKSTSEAQNPAFLLVATRCYKCLQHRPNSPHLYFQMNTHHLRCAKTMSNFIAATHTLPCSNVETTN